MPLEHRCRFPVILPSKRRARFLQCVLRGLDVDGQRCACSFGHAHRLGGLEAVRGRRERGRHLRQETFCPAAGSSFPVRCVPRGGLGPLAAVERVVQRQPVIALLGGLFSPPHGVGGGLQLLGRVLLRTGGLGGVDCALRLVHFLEGRLRTRGEQRAAKRTGRKNNAKRRRHSGQYTHTRIAIEAPTMKHLPVHDRPREKLARVGPPALGDNELLAIVIGHGTAHRDALGMATDLLNAAGGLRGLARSSLEDLQRAVPLGTARAARVLAGIELGRRTLTRVREERPRFLGPSDMAAYLLPQFGDRTVEHFGVVLLDAKRRLLRTAVLSVGTLDASVAHPREIFREAALGGASAIVAFHNHPSGDPTPSRDDVQLTRRLMEAGEIIGIDVLDHLILAETRYFSFKESEKL